MNRKAWTILSSLTISAAFLGCGEPADNAGGPVPPAVTTPADGGMTGPAPVVTDPAPAVTPAPAPDAKPVPEAAPAPAEEPKPADAPKDEPKA